MANSWIEYIKKVAKETGKSYKEAMSIASDRKKKGAKVECESSEKKHKKSKRNKSGKRAKGTKKRRGSSKRR